MKMILKPKYKENNNTSVIAYRTGEYPITSRFNHIYTALPILFNVKYNEKANYLPIDVILYGESGMTNMLKSFYSRRKKDVLQDLDDIVSLKYPIYNVDKTDWKTGFVIKSGVLYKMKNDTLTPLVGLFVKNSVINRISLKKDLSMNKAINSSVFTIPMDSVLYIHPNCLVKGTTEEKLFGVLCRKLKKKYDFLELTDSLSIFDDLFDHKIKEPRGFAEFEQFNSTVNTHLNSVLNEIYE